MSKYRLGQKITLPRGQKGARPDFYAAQITSTPERVELNGRLVEVADVISAEKTRAGQWRLRLTEMQNLRYVFPIRRADADPEALLMLDGPATQPKTVFEIVADQAAQAMAWLESRPETVEELALDDIAD